MVRTRRAAKVAEPLMGRPSWNRALEIPEILSIVFQHATKDTTAVSLKVCRFWFDVGIEVLWRDLDALIPLFSLVAPMNFDPSQTKDGLWTGPLAGDLPTTNWRRFRLYASQVKTLVYNSDAPWGGQPRSCVSAATIEAISFHHPFGQSLLPHLQTLTWKSKRKATAATMMSIMPFLSASLTRLELHHLNTYLEPALMPLRSIFHSLEYRCPLLNTFLLNTSFPCSMLQDAMLTWLNAFKGLSHITLSPQFISHRITEVLSEHTKLQSFRANCPTTPAALEDEEALRFPSGSFKTLRDLDLIAPSNRATELFTDAMFQHLRTLVVECNDGISPEDLQNLTFVISASCPALRQIRLRLQCSNTSLSFGEGRLTVDHIRPLLNCPNLTPLVVYHNYPFIVSPSDIEEMGRRWPRLQTLFICPNPNVPSVWTDSAAGNPIGILQSFARYLPSLHQLGLYINQTEPAPSLDDDIPANHRFRWLAFLTVGLSRVPGDDPMTVASFIESVTTSVPEFLFGTYPTGYRGDLPPASIMDQASRWAEVTRALQLFRKKTPCRHADPVGIRKVGCNLSQSHQSYHGNFIFGYVFPHIHFFHLCTGLILGRYHLPMYLFFGCMYT